MYSAIFNGNVATGFISLSTALLFAEDWAKRGYKVLIVEGLE